MRVAYAEEQLGLLKEFGRFPDRNEILGRENTKEEAKYLASRRGPYISPKD